MDDLFTLPLEPDQIAGTHACTCNPRKLAHYPKDWYALRTIRLNTFTSASSHSPNAFPICLSIRTPENCAYTAQTPPALSQPPMTIVESAPIGHHLINGGLIILTPNKDLFEELVTFLKESPLIKDFSFADQDLYAT